MKKFLKTYWKTLLFFAVMGLVGGFGVGLYLMDTYPQEIRQEIYNQGVTDLLLAVISAVQAAGYGLVLGAAGIWLAKKVGLWKDQRSIEKKPLTIAFVISAFVAALEPKGVITTTTDSSGLASSIAENTVS